MPLIFGLKSASLILFIFIGFIVLVLYRCCEKVEIFEESSQVTFLQLFLTPLSHLFEAHFEVKPGSIIA